MTREKWDQLYKDERTPWRGTTKALSIFHAFLKDGQGKRALDLGCGAGEFVIRLDEYGYDSIGLDISLEAINSAQQNTAKKTFQVWDLEELGRFPGTDFDIILDSKVLRFINDRRAYLSAISDRVATGGYFLLLIFVQRCGRKPFDGKLARLSLTEEEIEALLYNHFQCFLAGDVSDALRAYVAWN